MVQFNYAHDSKIPVDRCPAGHGVWLDAGKLELVAQYRQGTPAVRRLGEAMMQRLASERRLRQIRAATRSKTASATAAILCMVVGWTCGLSGRSLASLLSILALSLACIWFPEGMGRYRGISGLGRPEITFSSPADAVAVAGWLVMFAMFFVLLYLS